MRLLAAGLALAAAPLASSYTHAARPAARKTRTRMAASPPDSDASPAIAFAAQSLARTLEGQLNVESTESVIPPLEAPLFGGAVSLDDVRLTLARQEDSLVFALLERAQFRQDLDMYLSEGIDWSVGHDGFASYIEAYALEHEQTHGGADSLDRGALPAKLSLLDYMMLETERAHARLRRYAAPDEHPFSPYELLPEPALPKVSFPQLIAPFPINLNAEIKRQYIDRIIPAICTAGDDKQYGSAAQNDIIVLQVLSRRIHLGMFVAEIKYRSDPATYRELAAANDVEGILERLTVRPVEDMVVSRARQKAAQYGGDPTGKADGYFVNPDVVGSLYADVIMPLTKEVEVQYLLRRAAGEAGEPMFMAG